MKFTKFMSLYQIIYIILHTKKKKTPLHMMTAYTIYDKCERRELSFLIILKYVSATDKFKKQKPKRDLTEYTLMQSGEVLSPHLATFAKTCSLLLSWTILVIKTNHHHTGMNSNHDTVQALFQFKLEYAPSKPLQSSVRLRAVSN